MRRTLIVGAIVFAAGLAASPAAQADPRGGSIVGSGTAGNGTFTMNAVAGKNGKTSGTASFQLAIGSLAGNVQFVSLSNSDGCLAGVVTSSTIGGVDPGQGYTVQVRDLTPPPPSDQLQDQLQLQLGTITNACNIGIVSPAGVTSGDIKVTTNARP